MRIECVKKVSSFLHTFSDTWHKSAKKCKKEAKQMFPEYQIVGYSGIVIYICKFKGVENQIFASELWI